MNKDAVFDSPTPLEFTVQVSRVSWEQIVTVKHPVMRDRELEVRDALHEPDEIRRSRADPAVFLFYRLERPGRWVCAVAKRLNAFGFLITAYLTDAIKEGERVWSK